MNPQHFAQSRSSANGFTRRRGEKETGTKENKFQPGKSHISRMTPEGVQTGNTGRIESPSYDRLVYITTCFIGHQVEVQVHDGSLFTGIFHATNAEKDFGIILKMARVTKAGRGQKNISDFVRKPPSKTLIIPGKELVQIVAKGVPVTRDGLVNELQNDQLHDIMIDSSISQSRHVDLERELAPWVPDDDNPECPELDNTFDRHWNRGWDQFEANATLFGVKSTFDEELYTTKLDRGPQMRELEIEALRLAREIEGEDTQDLHLAEERGIRFHDKLDLDEETKYSSVYRRVDDSGYNENEDILTSQNIQTYGDVSDSLPNNGSQLTSCSSTLEDVQSTHLSTSNDFHEQNQTSKSEVSSVLPNKESTDKEVSATATASAPTNASSKAREKTRSNEVSSTPATAASGPGLSPSSSVGSLTSEKSTLNPHAKEFRLNPNAKSFVPSSPIRAASPVSDASFYYPANVAPSPHMHGMPVGIGMGPAFPSHQPVIFGPQGTPMQPPPTFFHPNSPQYGQQMLLGQPRQMVYMPTYPPEMPYKGREF